MARLTRQKFPVALRIAFLSLSLLLLTSSSWVQVYTKQEVNLQTERLVNHSGRQELVIALNKYALSSVVDPSVGSIQAPISRRDIQNRAIEWTRQNQLLVIAILIVPVLYLGILWLFPQLLILLVPAEFKIPKTEFKVPLRVLLCLKYPPRVLNAWVTERISNAQKNFEERETVKERKVHIPISVDLDGNPVPSLTAENLQPMFDRKQSCLLIWGEGGAGKTSLACQIAKWVMEEDKAKRLFKHRMLPVLIEEEPDKPLIEAIGGQLRNLVDEGKPISEELLKQLLEKRRILVILDHFSEMSKTTCKAIEDPNSPFNVLLVTSRIKSILGTDVIKTTLNPQRVSGDRLLGFLQEYLKQKLGHDPFEDRDYHDACLQLSQITSDNRDITVLIAKLYADLMIRSAENSDTSVTILITEDLPDNVPDLMLSYLNELNRNITERRLENEVVHRTAKAIAWECLKQSYKPERAKREQVLDVLATKDANDKAEEHLKYLTERRLGLIRIIEPDYKHVRFELDPLAEYLAGLHLVEHYSGDETCWHKFLAQAENTLGTLQEIKGFLLAVRDCCIVKGSEANVPDFVTEELGRLAGLDLGALEREQLKRRVRQLISDLSRPNAEDRAHAAEALGGIGSSARTAVPALIKALRDEDSRVRCNAAIALGHIGPEAVLELAEALRDENLDVRIRVLVALETIGLAAAAAVPALAVALKDEYSEVRIRAAQVLASIGSAAKAAVPALRVALSDEDSNVRAHVAQGLASVGPAAAAAVPELRIALRDRDRRVQSNSAGALRSIGPAAAAAVPDLVEALNERDDFGMFHSTIVAALGDIGPATAVEPALVKACRSDNAFVLQAAWEALRRVRGQVDQ